MKIQSIISLTIAVSLLAACSQETAKSPTSNAAVYAAAHIPNQPSEEARVVKDILFNTKARAKRFQTELKQLIENSLKTKKSERQTIAETQDLVKAFLADNQRDLATLKKLNIQDDDTKFFQEMLIKLFEQTSQYYDKFLRTGEMGIDTSLDLSQGLSQNFVQAKQMRFEAQFVKQPEILLDAASLFEMLDRMEQWNEKSSARKIEPNASKEVRMAQLLEIFQQDKKELENVRQQDTQLVFQDPAFQDFQKGWLELAALNIQLLDIKIKRLQAKQSKETTRDVENALNKQIDEKSSELKQKINEMDLDKKLDQARQNLK